MLITEVKPGQRFAWVNSINKAFDKLMLDQNSLLVQKINDYGEWKIIVYVYIPTGELGYINKCSIDQKAKEVVIKE
jgi:hypothetical protein